MIQDILRARARQRERGHPLLRRGYAYVDRPNPSLDRILPPDCRFLDVGCGRGANLATLTASGRRTGVGLELDADAAATARAAGLEVVVGDVREPSVRDSLAEEYGPFDVILFADVLEHLVEPDEVLLAASRLLGDGGQVALSIPNVAVWYQRLALLCGRFEYDETGILDRTHLRFFTRSSLRWWLESLGYQPERWTVTPSLVVSVARFILPLARQRGDDMQTAMGRPFELYLKWVEPIEWALCSTWPGLMANQHIVLARAPS